jgi:hypothetical protein
VATRHVVTLGVLACAAAMTTAPGITAPAGPPALEAVLADAAKRTGTDARNVQVVKTEPKDWPNTGLGCPRPGEMHAQVITPGWLIEVRSGERVLEYHTDTRDRFVLCTPGAH